MTNKFLDKNGLLYLWGKIIAKIDGVYNSVQTLQSQLTDYAKKSDIPTTEETVNAVINALPTWQGGEY